MLCTVWCLRCLLLVMCTHPFAKKALTLHLARSEGHERYFGCNLMHRQVLAPSHQHLMAEAPRNEYLVAENRVLRNQIQGRLRLTDGLSELGYDNAWRTEIWRNIEAVWKDEDSTWEDENF